jgi:hypothetical protein
MTRAKKIGYFHAAIATAWYSTAALDFHHIVNGVLGDFGCETISILFALPLTWLAGMTGFPHFPSLPEHFVRMSFIGGVVVVNGLVVGYCIDAFLAWSGIPERAARSKGTYQGEQAGSSNGG